MQSGLDDFSDGKVPLPGVRQFNVAKMHLSDKAELTKDSCPFCLHPAEEFIEREFHIGCPNCMTNIPVDADWYQRGEKIVI